LAPKDPGMRLADPVRNAALDALKLSDLLDKLWARLGRTDVRQSDFPMITMRRDEAWARIQFRAGVSLLRHAELAYAAECQLRGLLDYQALVGWIVGKSMPKGSGDPGCRAICIEIQRDRTMIRAAQASRVHWLPKGHIEALTRRMQSHQKILVRHGCRCAGSFNTTNVLKRLTDAGAVHKQTPERWRLTSQLVHQGLSDRVLKQVGGTVGFTPAPPSYRAGILIWLVRAYAITARWIVELDDPLAASEFNTALVTSIEKEDLGRALDGAYD
jgi:hypothetical protein